MVIAKNSQRFARVSHVGGAAVDAARAEFFAHDNADSVNTVTVRVARTVEYLTRLAMVTWVTEALTRGQTIAMSIASLRPARA